MTDSGFRKDIQGLRALAVLAVIGYHAHLPGFSGGFAGVDVFFVISGFLITSLIIREIEVRRTIDLAAFWARRARRLLPNALLVLVLTLVASRFLAPVTEQLPIAHDIAAAATYVANYRLAGRAVDYFDQAQAASPALHFWSLSVEEQFYIVWPLLLVLLIRLPNGTRRDRIGWALVVIAAASFAASLYWLTKSQPAAFFHTEARIWQLATGAALAAFATPERLMRLSPRLLDAIAWTGLLGIVTSITLLNDRLVYPGYLALVPVLATAAAILGGRSAPTSTESVLGLKPLQWTGDRSYSLYLWHWPPLALIAGTAGEAPALTAVALGIGALGATAAYVLVEQPMRYKLGIGRNPRAVVGMATAACVAVAAAGVLMVNTGLIPGAGADLLAKVEAAKKDGPRLQRGCMSQLDADTLNPCLYGDASTTRMVVLLGDSHAQHLFDALDEAGKREKWALKVWARPRCPPIDRPIYDPTRRVWDEGCTAFRKRAVEELIRTRPQLVVLSSATERAQRMYADDGHELGRAESQELWRTGFKDMLTRLTAAGLNVLVVRDTPRSRQENVLDCLARYGISACATPRGRAIDPDQPDVVVAETVEGVRVLDLTDRVCGPNVCQPMRDSVIVYRDSNHLTATYSRTLAPAFVEVLRAIDPPADAAGQ